MPEKIKRSDQALSQSVHSKYFEFRRNPQDKKIFFTLATPTLFKTVEEREQCFLSVWEAHGTQLREEEVVEVTGFNPTTKSYSIRGSAKFKDAVFKGFKAECVGGSEEEVRTALWGSLKAAGRPAVVDLTKGVGDRFVGKFEGDTVRSVYPDGNIPPEFLEHKKHLNVQTDISDELFCALWEDLKGKIGEGSVITDEGPTADGQGRNLRIRTPKLMGGDDIQVAQAAPHITTSGLRGFKEELKKLKVEIKFAAGVIPVEEQTAAAYEIWRQKKSSIITKVSSAKDVESCTLTVTGRSECFIDCTLELACKKKPVDSEDFTLWLDSSDVLETKATVVHEMALHTLNEISLSTSVYYVFSSILSFLATPFVWIYSLFTKGEVVEQTPWEQASHIKAIDHDKPKISHDAVLAQIQMMQELFADAGEAQVAEVLADSYSNAYRMRAALHSNQMVEVGALPKDKKLISYAEHVAMQIGDKIVGLREGDNVVLPVGLGEGERYLPHFLLFYKEGGRLLCKHIHFSSPRLEKETQAVTVYAMGLGFNAAHFVERLIKMQPQNAGVSGSSGSNAKNLTLSQLLVEHGTAEVDDKNIKISRTSADPVKALFTVIKHLKMKEKVDETSTLAHMTQSKARFYQSYVNHLIDFLQKHHSGMTGAQKLQMFEAIKAYAAKLGHYLGKEVGVTISHDIVQGLIQSIDQKMIGLRAAAVREEEAISRLDGKAVLTSIRMTKPLAETMQNKALDEGLVDTSRVPAKECQAIVVLAQKMMEVGDTSELLDEMKRLNGEIAKLKVKDPKAARTFAYFLMRALPPPQGEYGEPLFWDRIGSAEEAALWSQEIYRLAEMMGESAMRSTGGPLAPHEVVEFNMVLPLILRQIFQRQLSFYEGKFRDETALLGRQSPVFDAALIVREEFLRAARDMRGSAAILRDINSPEAERERREGAGRTKNPVKYPDAAFALDGLKRGFGASIQLFRDFRLDPIDCRELWESLLRDVKVAYEKWHPGEEVPDALMQQCARVFPRHVQGGNAPLETLKQRMGVTLQEIERADIAAMSDEQVKRYSDTLRAHLTAAIKAYNKLLIEQMEAAKAAIEKEVQEELWLEYEPLFNARIARYKAQAEQGIVNFYAHKNQVLLQRESALAKSTRKALAEKWKKQDKDDLDALKGYQRLVAEYKQNQKWIAAADKYEAEMVIYREEQRKYAVRCMGLSDEARGKIPYPKPPREPAGYNSVKRNLPEPEKPELDTPLMKKTKRAAELIAQLAQDFKDDKTVQGIVLGAKLHELNHEFWFRGNDRYGLKSLSPHLRAIHGGYARALGIPKHLWANTYYLANGGANATFGWLEKREAADARDILLLRKDFTLVAGADPEKERRIKASQELLKRFQFKPIDKEIPRDVLVGYDQLGAGDQKGINPDKEIWAAVDHRVTCASQGYFNGAAEGEADLVAGGVALIRKLEMWGRLLDNQGIVYRKHNSGTWIDNRDYLRKQIHAMPSIHLVSARQQSMGEWAAAGVTGLFGGTPPEKRAFLISTDPNAPKGDYVVDLFHTERPDDSDAAHAPAVETGGRDQFHGKASTHGIDAHVKDSRYADMAYSHYSDGFRRDPKQQKSVLSDFPLFLLHATALKKFHGVAPGALEHPISYLSVMHTFHYIYQYADLLADINDGQRIQHHLYHRLCQRGLLEEALLKDPHTFITSVGPILKATIEKLKKQGIDNAYSQSAALFLEFIAGNIRKTLHKLRNEQEELRAKRRLTREAHDRLRLLETQLPEPLIGQIEEALPRYDKGTVNAAYAQFARTTYQKLFATYVLDFYTQIPPRALDVFDWQMVINAYMICQKAPSFPHGLVGHSGMQEEAYAHVRTRLFPYLLKTYVNDIQLRKQLLDSVAAFDDNDLQDGLWEIDPSKECAFVYKRSKGKALKVDLLSGAGLKVQVHAGERVGLPDAILGPEKIPAGEEVPDYQFLFKRVQPKGVEATQGADRNITDYTWRVDGVQFCVRYNAQLHSYQIFQILTHKDSKGRQIETRYQFCRLKIDTALLNLSFNQENTSVESLIVHNGAWMRLKETPKGFVPETEEVFVPQKGHSLDDALRLHIEGEKIVDVSVDVSVGTRKEKRWVCSSLASGELDLMHCKGMKNLLLLSKDKSTIDEIRLVKPPVKKTEAEQEKNPERDDIEDDDAGPNHLVLRRDAKNSRRWNVVGKEGWYWHLEDTDALELRFGTNYREFMIPLRKDLADGSHLEEFWFFPYIATSSGKKGAQVKFVKDPLGLVDAVEDLFVQALSTFATGANKELKEKVQEFLRQFIGDMKAKMQPDGPLLKAEISGKRVLSQFLQETLQEVYESPFELARGFVGAVVELLKMQPGTIAEALGKTGVVEIADAKAFTATLGRVATQLSTFMDEFLDPQPLHVGKNGTQGSHASFLYLAYYHSLKGEWGAASRYLEVMAEKGVSNTEQEVEQLTYVVSKVIGREFITSALQGQFAHPGTVRQTAFQLKLFLSLEKIQTRLATQHKKQVVDAFEGLFKLIRKFTDKFAPALSDAAKAEIAKRCYFTLLANRYNEMLVHKRVDLREQGLLLNAHEEELLRQLAPVNPLAFVEPVMRNMPMTAAEREEAEQAMAFLGLKPKVAGVSELILRMPTMAQVDELLLAVTRNINPNQREDIAALHREYGSAPCRETVIANFYSYMRWIYEEELRPVDLSFLLQELPLQMKYRDEVDTARKLLLLFYQHARSDYFTRLNQSGNNAHKDSFERALTTLQERAARFPRLNEMEEEMRNTKRDLNADPTAPNLISTAAHRIYLSGRKTLMAEADVDTRAGIKHPQSGEYAKFIEICEQVVKDHFVAHLGLNPVENPNDARAIIMTPGDIVVGVKAVAGLPAGPGPAPAPAPAPAPMPGPGAGVHDVKGMPVKALLPPPPPAPPAPAPGGGFFGLFGAGAGAGPGAPQPAEVVAPAPKDHGRPRRLDRQMSDKEKAWFDPERPHSYESFYNKLFNMFKLIPTLIKSMQQAQAQGPGPGPGGAGGQPPINISDADMAQFVSQLKPHFLAMLDASSFEEGYKNFVSPFINTIELVLKHHQVKELESLPVLLHASARPGFDLKTAPALLPNHEPLVIEYIIKLKSALGFAFGKFEKARKAKPAKIITPIPVKQPLESRWEESFKSVAGAASDGRWKNKVEVVKKYFESRKAVSSMEEHFYRKLCEGVDQSSEELKKKCTRSLFVDKRFVQLGKEIARRVVLADQEAKKCYAEIVLLVKQYAEELHVMPFFADLGRIPDKQLFEHIIDRYQSGAGLSVAVLEEKITQFLLAITERDQLRKAQTVHQRMEAEHVELCRKLPPRMSAGEKAREVQRRADQDIFWLLSSDELFRYLSEGTDRLRYADPKTKTLLDPSLYKKYLVMDYRNEQISRAKAKEAIHQVLHGERRPVLYVPDRAREAVQRALGEDAFVLNIAEETRDLPALEQKLTTLKSQGKVVIVSDEEMAVIIDRRADPRYVAIHALLTDPSRIARYEPAPGVAPVKAEIEKVLLSSVHFIKVRMGVGKSTFIFPILARKLIEMGREPVMMTTEALLPQLRDFMDEKAFVFEFDINFGLGQAYDKDGNKIMHHPHEVIMARLRKLAASLKGLKKDGSYVLTTPARMLFIRNKCAELEFQMKDMAPDSEQAREKFAQLQLMKEIHGYFFRDEKDKSILYLQDEDVTRKISIEYNYATGNPEPVDTTVYNMYEKFMLTMLIHDERLHKLLATDGLRSIRDERELMTALTPVVMRLYRDVEFWEHGAVGGRHDEWRNHVGARGALDLRAVPQMVDYIFEEDQRAIERLPADLRREVEFLRYVFGKQQTPPFGFDPRPREMSPLYRHVTALKMLLCEAGTFRSVYKDSNNMDRILVGLCTQPADKGQEKPGYQFGNSFEYILHNQFKYAVSAIDEFRFEQLVKQLSRKSEEIISPFNPRRTWGDWIRAVQAAGGAHADPYKGFKSEACWKERLELLRYVIFNHPEMLKHKIQVLSNSQDSTIGHEANMGSGTGDAFSQNLATAQNDSSAHPDLIGAETLLCLFKLTDGADGAKGQGLDAPVATFSDPEKFIRRHVCKANCRAIINGGYEVEGNRMERLVERYREQLSDDPVGGRRQFLYVNSDQSEKAKKKKRIWNPGVEYSPVKYAHEAVNKETAIAIFGPVHSRGIDFRLPKGNKDYGVYMVDLNTTPDDFEQGLWRMRDLGYGQRGKVAVDKKMARYVMRVNGLRDGEGITVGHVMRAIIRKSLKIDAEVDNIKAATFAIKTPLKLTVERARRGAYDLQGVDPKDAQALVAFHQLLAKLHEEFFILKERIDWMKSYLPQQKQKWDLFLQSLLVAEQKKIKELRALFKTDLADLVRKYPMLGGLRKKYQLAGDEKAEKPPVAKPVVAIGPGAGSGPAPGPVTWGGFFGALKQQGAAAAPALNLSQTRVYEQIDQRTGGLLRGYDAAEREVRANLDAMQDEKSALYQFYKKNLPDFIVEDAGGVGSEVQVQMQVQTQTQTQIQTEVQAQVKMQMNWPYPEDIKPLHYEAFKDGHGQHGRDATYQDTRIAFVERADRRYVYDILRDLFRGMDHVYQSARATQFIQAFPTKGGHPSLYILVLRDNRGTLKSCIITPDEWENTIAPALLREKERGSLTPVAVYGLTTQDPIKYTCVAAQHPVFGSGDPLALQDMRQPGKENDFFRLMLINKFYLDWVHYTPEEESYLVRSLLNGAQAYDLISSLRAAGSNETVKRLQRLEEKLAEWRAKFADVDMRGREEILVKFVFSRTDFDAREREFLIETFLKDREKKKALYEFFNFCQAKPTADYMDVLVQQMQNGGGRAEPPAPAPGPAPAPAPAPAQGPGPGDWHGLGKGKK